MRFKTRVLALLMSFVMILSLKRMIRNLLRRSYKNRKSSVTSYRGGFLSLHIIGVL